MEPNRIRFRRACPWEPVRISKTRYYDRAKGLSNGLFPHTINFTDGAIISLTVIPGSSERVPGHGAPGTAARITMNNHVLGLCFTEISKIVRYEFLHRLSIVVSNTRTFCSYVYVIMTTPTLWFATCTCSAGFSTHFCQIHGVAKVFNLLCLSFFSGAASYATSDDLFVRTGITHELVSISINDFGQP